MFYSASEGKANNIRFAFGQSPLFKRNRFTFKDIYRLKAFDSSKNTTSDDLAVITLSSAVKITRRIATAVPSAEDTEDYYVS